MSNETLNSNTDYPSIKISKYVKVKLPPDYDIAEHLERIKRERALLVKETDNDR